jgi:hypothetical protein
LRIRTRCWRRWPGGSLNFGQAGSIQFRALIEASGGGAAGARLNEFAAVLPLAFGVAAADAGADLDHAVDLRRVAGAGGLVFSAFPDALVAGALDDGEVSGGRFGGGSRVAQRPGQKRRGYLRRLAALKRV